MDDVIWLERELPRRFFVNEHAQSGSEEEKNYAQLRKIDIRDTTDALTQVRARVWRSSCS
jgi:hypothetical protein